MENKVIWNAETKEWDVIGWDMKSCIRCKKFTEENSYFWYCEKCSYESFVEAIKSISCNSYEEIREVIKPRRAHYENT